MTVETIRYHDEPQQDTNKPISVPSHYIDRGVILSFC
jgi:hypothetical protein